MKTITLFTKTLLLFVFLMQNTISAQVPLPSGFVAKHDFNNNLENLVTGIPLTAHSSVVNELSYIDDRVLQSNNALQVSTAGAPNHGGGDMTGYTFNSPENSICFWMKNNIQHTEIIKAYSNGSGFLIESYANASEKRLRVTVGNGSSTVSSVNVPGLFDNNWHHIALTMDRVASGGYEIKVYIDGVINNSLSSNLGLSRNDIMFNISKTRVLTIKSSSPAYAGALDDLLVYNRVLSAQEVADVYNQVLIQMTPPKTIFVDKNATGANDGTSWADAFINIPDALTSNVVGDQVWVAQGTYTAATSGVTATFLVNNNGVNIYGGFTGTETSLSQRDPLANLTILSGDLSGNDTVSSPILAPSHNDSNRIDNALHVVTVTGNDNLIDGFTIKGGYANDTSVRSNHEGGGVWLDTNVLNFTLNNCIVEDNFAYSNAAGIKASTNNPSTLTISNCIIRHNRSRWATGLEVFCGDQSARMSVINIYNNIFHDNVSQDFIGGAGFNAPAMWLATTTTTAILNANVVNNTFYQNISNASGTVKATIGIQEANGATGGITTVFANNICWQDLRGTRNAPSISPITTNNIGSLTIKNSISETNFGNLRSSSAVTFSNNSDTNPNLTNPGGRDFSLTAQSISAIDKGDDTEIIGTQDALGNVRIFDDINTTNGAQGTVDIGAIEFNSITLSTADLKTEEPVLSVYPNPTIDKITLDSSVVFEEIILRDLTGKELLKTKQNIISLQHLPAGTYLLQVKTATGIISKKIIKK